MYFNTLSNGIKVALDKIPHTKIVTVNFMVKVGALNENKKNNGISHLIEHLLFKSKFSGKYKLITEYIDSIGSYINAFTAKEFTCFVVQSTNDYVIEVVEKLCNMIFYANFNEKDFLVERSVVLQELYQHQANIMAKSRSNGLKKMLGSNNSLSFDILGSKKTLQDMNFNDIVSYYKLNYIASKTSVSISGGIDNKNIYGVKEILKTIPSHNYPLNTSLEKTTNTIYSGDTREETKNTNQSYVCLLYPSVPRTDYKNFFKLMLLNLILGVNRNSRLFRTIREEKGLAYSINSIPITYQDIGTLSIQSIVALENENMLLDSIKDVIDDLCTNGISNDEFVASKNKLNTEIIFSLERTIDRARFWNEVQLFNNYFISPCNIKEILLELEKKQIEKLAQEIFNREPVVSLVGRGINNE